MPKFYMTLAHDVSVYGHVEVAADDLAAAAEKVRTAYDEDAGLWDSVNDVDYSTSHSFRIVSVGDETEGRTLAEGIPVSEPDDSTPLSAEEVLASVVANRISK